MLNNLLGFGFLIPKLLRKYYNILLDSDIDVVLDASGFQYSSQWGFKETKLMAQWSQSWNKKGKKVILMPQAFGPFNENRIKSYMLKIIENSHLIFVRDKTSFNYLSEITSTKINEQNIYLYPDFSAFGQPWLLSQLRHDPFLVTIVCFSPASVRGVPKHLGWNYSIHVPLSEFL